MKLKESRLGQFEVLSTEPEVCKYFVSSAPSDFVSFDLNFNQVLKWPTFGDNPSPLGPRPYQAGSD